MRVWESQCSNIVGFRNTRLPSAVGCEPRGRHERTAYSTIARFALLFGRELAWRADTSLTLRLNRPHVCQSAWAEQLLSPVSKSWRGPGLQELPNWEEKAGDRGDEGARIGAPLDCPAKLL